MNYVDIRSCDAFSRGIDADNRYTVLQIILFHNVPEKSRTSEFSYRVISNWLTRKVCTRPSPLWKSKFSSGAYFKAMKIVTLGKLSVLPQDVENERTTANVMSKVLLQ
jgi:hypothetical protein